jgi:16S rRNA (uracil1498-N3)-methyltransferase
MVERSDRPAVTTFFSPESFSSGASLTLGEDVAHHARVTRLQIGAPVSLRDGAGGVATGTLARIGKSTAVVSVEAVMTIERPPQIHLLAPVADRERMLWLAEKAAEFGVASWRPVMWRRSKSVSPRGEGPMFQAKLKARMISALIQCGGAWLPDIFPEAAVEAAVAATPPGSRILLEKEGASGAESPLRLPVSIALGPEGGIEPAEREQFLAADFKPLKLASNTLRFETAGVAGIAVVTAGLTSIRSNNG